MLLRFSSVGALLLSLASVQANAQGGLHGKPGGNPKETADYLRGLKWADNLPYASATFYVKWSNTDSALIKVVPMDTAQKLSWFDAVKPNHDGYFTARIYNLEGKYIKPLNMQAADTGYVWVGQRNYPAPRGAAIYVIDANGAVKRHRNKHIVGYCNTGQHPGPLVYSTESHNCDKTPIHGNQLFHTASMKSMFFYISGGGLWISCTGGCCEVRLT